VTLFLVYGFFRLIAAYPWSCKRRDDAVQCAKLLLSTLRALEEAAQVTDHAWTAFAIAQKAVAHKLFLQVVEEVDQLFLGGRPAPASA
jgi:hypothetical protein